MVLKQIRKDPRKRTWIAQQRGLPITMITDIKALPLADALEKYCG